MNIFERASRRKLRFSSPKGQLTTEQVWELPLIARNGQANTVTLDSLARRVSAELREQSEESFVEVEPNPQRKRLELQLDILKHVIRSKQSDIRAAEARRAKANERQVLLDALATKEHEEIRSQSKEQILARLAELESGRSG